MYKVILTIAFFITIVFGVTMFTVTYKTNYTSFIKLPSDKDFILYNNDVYTESIAYFKSALATELNDSNALNDKGNDLSDQGKDNEAIEYYDKALAIEPDHVDSLYDKGISLNRLGNYTEAIEYYDKALAIEPDHVLALTNKGVSLDWLGRPNDAIIHFDKALSIEPNSIYTLNNKATSLYHLGNFTEAIEYHDKVLAIDPNHTDALSKKEFILNLIQTSLDFKTYQHPGIGFTVKYPSNSDVQEEFADGVEFLIQEGSSVLINIRQLQEEQILEQFTHERRISLQKSFENVEFPSEPIETILVGGYPADQTIFGFDSYENPGERMLGVLVTSVINRTTAIQLLFVGNSEQPIILFVHMKNTFDISGTQQQEIQSNRISNRILLQ